MKRKRIVFRNRTQDYLKTESTDDLSLDCTLEKNFEMENDDVIHEVDVKETETGDERESEPRVLV